MCNLGCYVLTAGRCLLLADLLLGLLFEPEDEGDIFPPKFRSLSELYGVTTQRTYSSYVDEHF
jgi:hypothetical protein